MSESKELSVEPAPLETEPFDANPENLMKGVAAAALADPKARPPPKHERPTRGWFQWVPSDRNQLARTESCILHFLSHRFLQRYVAGLNTVSSLPVGGSAKKASANKVDRHILLLHGFGGGLAMWVANFNFLVSELSKNPNETSQVHAVDLPGFARSERHPMVKFETDRSAMDYMCGHLRNWFREISADRPMADGELPRVELVGHSFGGYIAANYASRYPQLVHRVVLCDPWGVPSKPDDIEAHLARRHRMLVKLFYAGNPFSLLRGAGPFGPKLLPSVRKDFADRWEPIIGDANVFFDYVFHCNANPHPTGEQAFQACCTGPVFAKTPLEVIVPKIPPSVNIGLLYGAQTWMDKTAGFKMMEEARRLRGSQCQTTEAIVPNAGHQLNTDNVDGFNAALSAQLRLGA